jgi:hypothetical protein
MMRLIGCSAVTCHSQPLLRSAHPIAQTTHLLPRSMSINSVPCTRWEVLPCLTLAAGAQPRYPVRRVRCVDLKLSRWQRGRCFASHAHSRGRAHPTHAESVRGEGYEGTHRAGLGFCMTEFVTYLREGHDFRERNHIEDAMRRMVDCLNT